MEKASQKRSVTDRKSGELCHTLIISGGSIEPEFVRALLKEYHFSYIIAADAGLRFLYREGLTPTHIVGDFDSLEQEILDHYTGNPNVIIRMFSPIKDATDTEIALHLAVELSSTDIWLTGAGGVRFDHTLGNIQSMVIPLRAGIPCIMADSCNRIQLLDHGTSLKRAKIFGKYLSFFPLGGPVKGLTLTGVKYPLSDHELKPDDSLGVSNEVTEDEAVISFRRGMLIMIQSKDRDQQGGTEL